MRTLAWESEAGGFAAGCSGYERTAEPGCCGSGVTGCKDLTTVQNSEGHRADGRHYRVLLSSSLPWIWVQLTGTAGQVLFLLFSSSCQSSFTNPEHWSFSHGYCLLQVLETLDTFFSEIRLSDDSSLKTLCLTRVI